MSYNKERYRTLKNIAYYLLFGLLYVVSLLPLWLLHGVSSLLSFLLYHVVRYRRDVVHSNIASAFPEMSQKEHASMERQFYVYFSDLVVEWVKSFSMTKRAFRRHMQFKGMELLEESCRKGRSCAIFLGHYANWEWTSTMPLWLDPKLCLVSQLYHPLENYVTDQLILHTRHRFGGVNITADKSIKYIVENQRKGKPLIVGFVADQAPFWDNIYFWSQFLNHETPWFTGAERIVQKLDMDAYYLDIYRVKRGYYVAECKLITNEPKKAEQFWITNEYGKMLEETIRRQPPYWLWSHRRWKRTKEEWLRITNGGIKPKNR